MTEAEVVDRLLSAMLWSRAAADHARANLRISAFAGRAGVAALIDDHDLTHPDAPAEGPDRLMSIVESVVARAQDVLRARRELEAWRFNHRVGPEPTNPYTDPAASLAAGVDGRPDPMLLAHAARVLVDLPQLAVAVDLTAPPIPTQLVRILNQMQES